MNTWLPITPCTPTESLQPKAGVCVNVHTREHMCTHTHTYTCAQRPSGGLTSAPGSHVWSSSLMLLSFTCQLAVKAGEPDGKGLDCTQWVVVVQREHVICHTPKLHDNVVRVIIVHYLEVLH